MLLNDINYIGVRSLLYKEIYRFIKVYNQTLLAPLVNILLFLMIFSVIGGQNFTSNNGVDFKIFISAGLIMMASLQNSFANSSSSIIMSKVLGYITDIVVPPISAGEFVFSVVVAAIFRGFAIALITSLVLYLFIGFTIQNIWICILYLFLSNMLMGLIGILCAILSESFDHMAAFTSYLITPLTFLSGTFYSINRLPEFWYNLSKFNPFFYMIDGFRHGVTGFGEEDLTIGITYISLLILTSWIVAYKMYKNGYRIKN